jgi:hypothetical protein
MYKPDLGRQREDRILVTEEEILHETESSKRHSAQEIRQNRDILNRIRLSWTRGAEASVANFGRHSEHLLLCFIQCFYSQLQSFYFVD